MAGEVGGERARPKWGGCQRPVAGVWQGVGWCERWGLAGAAGGWRGRGCGGGHPEGQGPKRLELEQLELEWNRPKGPERRGLQMLLGAAAVERLVLERLWLERLGHERWALEPARWGLVRWGMERRMLLRARHAYVPGETSQERWQI